MTLQEELCERSSEDLASMLSPSLPIQIYLAITEILDSRDFEYELTAQ